MCDHCGQDHKITLVQGLIVQSLTNYVNFLNPSAALAMQTGDHSTAQAAFMLRVAQTKAVIALLETMAASGFVGMARPTDVPVWSDGEEQDTAYQLLIRQARHTLDEFTDPSDPTWPEAYRDRLEESVRILDAWYEAEVAEEEDREITFGDEERAALEELRRKFVVLADKEPSHDGA